MANTTASRKAKGRKLQQYVRDLLRKKYDMCDPDDITSTSMGISGTDVVLSPFARQYIKFDIECKAQENLSIWSCLKQTEANTKEGRIPLLVFKRNHSKAYAVIELSKFLELI